MRTIGKAGVPGALAFLALLLALSPGLRADGFIVPHPRHGEIIPPLTVKYHHVSVEIVNQVAKTSVDQVFVNNFDRDIEGTYIFPVPENAAIDEFAMFIGGQRVAGEILDSRRARQVYEDIVRRMKDPGLLEYIGRNMFQARVYPIPARGEKRVQISYTEVLRSDNDLVRYLYPLNTEKFSRDPLKDLSLTVQVESPVPLLNVYSPSHKISVRKSGDRRATAGFEESGARPDKDFVLFYSLSKDDIGLSFMNWEGPDGGYFMLLAAPRYAADRDKALPKNLVLVLDSSGSMSGAKIAQAKDAARFIVKRLGADDRFSLIDFDDDVNLFSETLLSTSRENVDKALKFIDGVEDSGSTDIDAALQRALKLTPSGDRPSYILFLTDGLPTTGVTETAEILRDLERADTAKARILVFGVGDDVNTELLDRIASDHHGASNYVAETENIEAAVSSTYEKIASPVLSDLGLEFRGIETNAFYPRSLPDLFRGSQLVVVGKYRGAGPVTAVLSGRAGGEGRRFVLESRPLLHGDDFRFLPRLWATRRIGTLLEEIRLRGPNQELTDEVRKLGLKYGIVTPYTSFLVTEKERHEIFAAAPEAQDAMAARQVTGGGAVKAAKISLGYKAAPTPAQVVSQNILYRDDKTFYFKNGVWTDSEYKDGGPVKEVIFNSDEYFRLAADKPGIVRYLSAGQSLIVVYEGISYRIVPAK